MSEDVGRALKETGAPATGDLSSSTLRRLGRDLDCTHAVTGAYLLHDGQLRLDVRLVDLLDGSTESEQSFEQPESSLLPLLAEVQTRVARDLGVSSEPGDLSLTQVAHGLSPEAYRLYAEGAAANRSYDGEAATRALTRLLAIEPDFALAHLQLSLAWSERGEEKQSAMEATRAEQLAGSLPREQQLVIHARVESAAHLFAAAADTYRLLFRFFPDTPEYGRLLVQSLSDAGQSDQAMEEGQGLLATLKSQEPDPMTDSILADLYSNRGDWPKALEWAQKGTVESQKRGALVLYERLLTTSSQANFYLGNYQAAEAQTEEALGLANRFDDVSGQLRALNRMGQIYTAEQRWAPAEVALTTALGLEQKLDQSQRQIHTLLSLSRLSDQQQKLKAASEYARQAARLADVLGHVEVQTEARLQEATLLGKSGSRDEALQQLVQVRASAVKSHDAYLQKQAELVSATLQARP